MRPIRGAALLVMLVAATFTQFALGLTEQPTLVVSPALPSVPSDGAEHPALFITIEDGKGKPYPLASALNVTVSCSDERVLTVPHEVTIPAGLYYAVVNASSLVQEKKTVEVSVSASGFKSSKINVAAEPPAGAPKSLDVTLLPDVLIPRAGAYVELIVTIVDAYGKPADARTDLTVTLSSSNLQMADITPRTLSIPAGSSSGKARVVSKGFVGTAIITASASNLKPDSATVKISGSKPEKLTLSTMSSYLEGDVGKVFVGIVDKDTKPAKTPVPVRVNLYSTNTTVLTVPSYITVATDEWMALATITCLNAGTASVYALAEDMSSISFTIKVYKGTGNATAIKIYPLASYFPADEKTATYLGLQVVDSQGRPTRLPFDRPVAIYSTFTDIFGTQSSVDMTALNSVAYAQGTPKSAGTVKVTVGAGNFPSSEATVNVYSPTASTVGIITPPIPAGGEVEACLVASSGGIPAPVSQDTLIQLTSSDTLIAGVDATALLTKKSYYTIFTISGKSPGQFSLTAQGSGLPSASVAFSVQEVRPSLFQIAYVKPLAQTEFPVVIQSVSSQGGPVVSDDPITISIASSNTTTITLPSSVTIPAEASDVLTKGRAFVLGKTLVTITSGGFNSLSVEVSAQAMNGGIEIQAAAKYRAGGSTRVSAIVSLEGKPVVGARVTWRGVGLYATETTTDSAGKTDNVLAVKEGTNTVEAEVTLTGMGTITAQKRITGERYYTLDVASNIGVAIEGSGSYLAGTATKITAPLIIEVTGVMGMLGAKQAFRRWTGASQSSNNTVDVLFVGEPTDLALLAEYETDYMDLYMRVGAVLLALTAVILGVLWWRNREG